ncbi:hypothetical protein Barb7_01755 [Bacteroidales bacterium Barb7]|nr:hypothetical protein Barb7_01755 [Bacteroidales bacterium Barb7]
MFNGKAFQLLPSFLRNGLVVIFIFFGSPPNGVLCGFIQYEEFVFGRTTGVNARHYVHGIKFGHLPFFKTFQSRLCFFFVQVFKRRVVHDFLHSGNTVLA